MRNLIVICRIDCPDNLSLPLIFIRNFLMTTAENSSNSSW